MDILQFVIYCSFFGICFGGLQCKDANGKPVDWFVIYKLPVLKQLTEEVKKGTGILYADVNSKKWTLLDEGMDSEKQPVAYTLKQFYDSKKQKDSKVLSILYSDQAAIPSNVTTIIHGHAKGVIAYNNNGGFWLIHSMPRFPRADQYEYPESARRNGQTVMCLSTTSAELPSIVEQFFYNRVYVYYSLLPSKFDEIPYLKELLTGKYRKVEPYSRVVEITTLGGASFTSFAKTAKFGQDLYSDLVAPKLEVSLGTETWQNGGRNLPSNCSGKYKVQNIETIDITLNKEEIMFSCHKDHSKFAVAIDAEVEKKHWFCIGDVNRQIPQMKRGGGTVCLKDEKMHKIFEDAVKELQPCPIP